MGGNIMSVKCIYCNSIENLTDSDIIPYALTGAKIKKRFVCSEHNGHTNREFEKDTITSWDYFRSQLGFKTREGDLIKYNGSIVIDELVFDKVKISDKRTFYTGQIISTNHDGHKVIAANSEIIKKRFKTDPEIVDTNKISVQYQFNLENLFISDKMKRTMAKIAYEWYCYKYEINERLDKHNTIISYIINGVESEGIIECVVDAYSYMVGEKLCELGTHSIYDYIDEHGNNYVIFNFWNVIIYKIRVSDDNIPRKEKENIIEMQRYNLDGTKDSISFGVYSLNGGYDAISEPCEVALNRLYKLFINNLEKLVTQTVLTIYQFKKFADALHEDLEGLKNDEITIADFLEYEDWTRILIVRLIFLLKSYDYKFDLSFNSNISEMLEIEEFFTVDSKQLEEYTLEIMRLHEDEVLITNLEEGLQKFDSYYENEMIINGN